METQTLNLMNAEFRSATFKIQDGELKVWLEMTIPITDGDFSKEDWEKLLNGGMLKFNYEVGGD